MFRLLLITLLIVTSAPAQAARLSPAERTRMFEQLSTCLVGGFRSVTTPQANRATVRRMVNDYFDLASIAAQKYGGRQYRRAVNKPVLMAHAADVLVAEIIEGRGFYQSGSDPKFSKRSLKPVRPEGRYQINGRMPGGTSLILRVSADGPRGCRIHALFSEGISASSLLDGSLIAF